MIDTVFHVAEPVDWSARTDTYEPEGLAAEGFIHCSSADQLDGVLDRHFGGRTDVKIVEIDAAKLGETLVFEDLYGLGEEYPHVYGVIPMDAVIDVTDGRSKDT